ncbi:hypothetical protein GGX14DRAFT_391984 [Mycena pura]|uniref:Uncharacterized protein n=1 Tax=Mycena pura TaxID=153505 RepID=A0AAD6VTH2_9AGAR|nr:hypothetical protein GGX14DRAFT_391984 [Mycena pura]
MEQQRDVRVGERHGTARLHARTQRVRAMHGHRVVEGAARGMEDGHAHDAASGLIVSRRPVSHRRSRSTPPLPLHDVHTHGQSFAAKDWRREAGAHALHRKGTTSPTSTIRASCWTAACTHAYALICVAAAGSAACGAAPLGQPRALAAEPRAGAQQARARAARTRRCIWRGMRGRARRELAAALADAAAHAEGKGDGEAGARRGGGGRRVVQGIPGAAATWSSCSGRSAQQLTRPTFSPIRAPAGAEQREVWRVVLVGLRCGNMRRRVAVACNVCGKKFKLR